jgi:hypothetical protein
MSAVRWIGRCAPALLSVTLLAGGLSTTSTSALAAPPGAQVNAMVDDSVLSSVFCTSRTNCWAVGNREINDVTLDQARHFTGSRWRLVSTPNPGGSAEFDTSHLDAVTCTSSKNCWAVGSFDKNKGELSLALHWNGRKWSRVATPNPAGTTLGHSNDLFGVACASAKDCWAAGDLGHPIGQGSTVFLNLMLHWNGRRWSQSHTPDPAGIGDDDANELAALTCASRTDCLSVGDFGTFGFGTVSEQNEVLQWNGTKWRNVTVPNPAMDDQGDMDSTLNAVACTTARKCSAVGDASTTTGFNNEALHLTRGKWHVVTAPDSATASGSDNQLSGVTCTADTNCWAVGGTGGTSKLNQALRWNGHKWFLATVPQPAGAATGSGNSLAADFCVTPKHCWAVGDTQSFGEPQINQILRLAGKTWVVAGPYRSG